MAGRDWARVLLGSIRIVNGVVALVAPGFLADRLGVDQLSRPAAQYVLRMFGIRTVLIGLDLFRLQGEEREATLRRGILIHASDTLAAGLAVVSGRLPARARAIVLISALNTALAVWASRRGWDGSTG